MCKLIRYPIVSTLLCLSISSTIAPASCEPKNFRTLQLLALKEMHETVIAAQKADDIMIREIDAVAKDLQQVLAHKMRNGNGTQPLLMNSAESARLANRLASLVAANPYIGNPYYKESVKSAEANDSIEPKHTSAPPAGSQSADPPPNNPSSPFRPDAQAVRGNTLAVRVKIIADPTVSFAQAGEWRKKTPEDWRDEPGTIHIVHNGYDSCLIWGAGIEGRPVFDRDKQRFKLVALRLGAH
jgi:hypothetical protein